MNYRIEIGHRGAQWLYTEDIDLALSVAHTLSVARSQRVDVVAIDSGFSEYVGARSVSFSPDGDIDVVADWVPQSQRGGQFDHIAIHNYMGEWE